MYYLNQENIENIGIDWHETTNIIDQAVNLLAKNDYAQPIKPYLRYKDLSNRIIAMPAYIGGDFNKAGIKWIASFPDNINKGIPRAHCLVILNESDTGKPTAIINTPLISIIRTASVSGLVIKYFREVRSKKNLNIGIIGWGPIGQYHYKMCCDILRDNISNIKIYDNKSILETDIEFNEDNRISIVKSWEEAFWDADIFITCTTSKQAYINKPPKDGSLHLNVSLRDYHIDTYDYFKNAIIVDDWNEVCRENTDIELMHQNKGLIEGQTKTIVDIVVNNCLSNYQSNYAIFFNPMGMAVFDIAISSYFLNMAIENCNYQTL